MSDINKSRRNFLAGSGALAVGSILPGGLFPHNVFAAPVEPWLTATVNSIDEMAGIAPFASFPANGKAYLRQQATDFCKIRMEKLLGPVVKKFIGRTTLGTIAPVFMAIFDAIFPNNTPTWNEIKTEIDKRIKAALEQYEYEQIVKKFMALIDAYQLRMETVKANNNGISDQSKWSLGKPGDWEALINMCIEIKNYFYNNPDFNRHYEAAQLVSDFNFIYFIALNARLQCFSPGDDISSSIALMAQFLQGQYDYLKKLAEVAFWDVCKKNSEYGYIALMTSQQWTVYNATPRSYPQAWIRTDLSGYDKYDRITYTHDLIQCRIRLYNLINAQVVNMCETQSAAIKAFNKNFEQNISDAISMMDDFIRNNYINKMNEFQMKTPYAEGGGYYGLTLPGLRDNYSSFRQDFKKEDAYVKFWPYASGEETSFYSVGDYPTIPDFSKGVCLYIPRGVCVYLYPEADFKGKYDSYPAKPETGSNGFVFNNPKSMKIRVNHEFWFEGASSERHEWTLGGLPRMARDFIVEFPGGATRIDILDIAMAQKP